LFFLFFLSAPPLHFHINGNIKLIYEISANSLKGDCISTYHREGYYSSFQNLIPHKSYPANPEPIVVVFEGKPCSGKTTYAEELEKILNKKGINSLDIKGYLQKQTAGELLGLIFGPLERNAGTMASAALTLKHVASYALEILTLLSVKRQKKDYEVLILQRLPEDFPFALASLMNSPNTSALLNTVSRLTGPLVHTDLIVHLSADEETLADRMKRRHDGRDEIHKRLLRADDERIKDVLKHHPSLFLELDTTAPKDENLEKVVKVVSSLLRQNQ
jgi:thymidylate kinase